MNEIYIQVAKLLNVIHCEFSTENLIVIRDILGDICICLF